MTEAKQIREMGIDDALTILRRKPVGPVEMGVARIALKACQSIGMQQSDIEREAGRGLSYSEELVLAEF